MERTLYRIQNPRTGKGPWDGFVEGAYQYTMTAAGNHDAFHARSLQAPRRYAFPDMTTLTDVFPIDDLRGLLRMGFEVVRVRVPAHQTEDGPMQVVYHAGAARVERFLT